MILTYLVALVAVVYVCYVAGLLFDEYFPRTRR